MFTHQLYLLSSLKPQFVLVFAQATSLTSCFFSLPLFYSSACIFCFPRSFLGVWKENKMSFLCGIPLSHRWTKKGAKQKIDFAKIPQPQPSVQEGWMGMVHGTKWKFMLESSVTLLRSLLLVLKRYRRNTRGFDQVTKSVHPQSSSLANSKEIWREK